MKTIAIIPCRNEELYIGNVVRETRRWVNDAIVIDDFSTDFSFYEARKAGAIVVQPSRLEIEPKDKPCGKGRAMIRGINAAKSYGAEILVFLDGDGQHNPSYIPALLDPIEKDTADVCLGMRLFSKMPRRRRIGIEILTLIFNFQNPHKLSDPMTGFWAIRTDALPDQPYPFSEKEWGLEIEIFTKCQYMNRQFTEVPVQMIYHPVYEDNSTLSSWKMGLKLINLVCKWRWRERL